MNTTNNKACYDDYFESVYAGANRFSREQFGKAAVEFDGYYSRLMPDDLDAEILDVGCGAGFFLYYLVQKGYQNILGIDVSGQQVKYCKENITENVKQIDAVDFLKGSEKKYRVIAAHDVLEHIPKDNVPELLALMHEALVDGGVLIVRVPNMANPLSVHSRFGDFTHETGYTEKSLFQVLWKAGFRHILISSTRIKTITLRNKVRSFIVRLYHHFIRFLYYIQDFTVPEHLGKNLIAICKKQQNP